MKVSRSEMILWGWKGTSATLKGQPSPLCSPAVFVHAVQEWLREIIGRGIIRWPGFRGGKPNGSCSRESMVVPNALYLIWTEYLTPIWKTNHHYEWQKLSYLSGIHVVAWYILGWPEDRRHSGRPNARSPRWTSEGDCNTVTSRRKLTNQRYLQPMIQALVRIIFWFGVNKVG